MNNNSYHGCTVKEKSAVHRNEYHSAGHTVWVTNHLDQILFLNHFLWFNCGQCLGCCHQMCVLAVECSSGKEKLAAWEGFGQILYTRWPLTSLGVRCPYVGHQQTRLLRSQHGNDADFCKPQLQISLKIILWPKISHWFHKLYSQQYWQRVFGYYTSFN